ncbi:nucleotidyltransferase [Spirochaetia bacterium]|nr:nucleotidyltransferase [Spirochaetia bacterium]
MRPVTEKIPKSMIDINGKPFIHHQLTLLKNKGISHIIICIGYLGEKIIECVGDGRAYGIKVEYSKDGDKLLGTGGAIKNIGNILPEKFFILYGDSYLDINYREIEENFLKSNKKGLMTVYKNEDKYDTSNVLFQDNKLKKYSKTNKIAEMNYIDYGLGILERSIFSPYQDGAIFDLAEIYEKLSDEEQLLGYEVFKRFYEIGSPDGLQDLRKILS